MRGPASHTYKLPPQALLLVQHMSRLQVLCLDQVIIGSNNAPLSSLTKLSGALLSQTLAVPLVSAPQPIVTQQLSATLSHCQRSALPSAF